MGNAFAGNLTCVLNPTACRSGGYLESRPTYARQHARHPTRPVWIPGKAIRMTTVLFPTLSASHVGDR